MSKSLSTIHEVSLFSSSSGVAKSASMAKTNLPDVLSMPVYERRFFLGLLNKENFEKQEKIEEMKEQAKTSGSKGTRTTKISGQNLKNRMNNGDLPLS